EDGIRDATVTGVQTCALPICAPITCTFDEAQRESVLAALTRYVRIVGESKEEGGQRVFLKIADIELLDRSGETPEERPLFEKKRSEERRVGKEWRRQE